jgi:hypothetical protein
MVTNRWNINVLSGVTTISLYEKDVEVANHFRILLD